MAKRRNKTKRIRIAKSRKMTRSRTKKLRKKNKRGGARRMTTIEEGGEEPAVTSAGAREFFAQLGMQKQPARPQRSAAAPVWCKDCSALGTKKRAAWGMPQDGKRQWCAACGRDHEGAVDLDREFFAQLGKPRRAATAAAAAGAGSAELERRKEEAVAVARARLRAAEHWGAAKAAAEIEAKKKAAAAAREPAPSPEPSPESEPVARRRWFTSVSDELDELYPPEPAT
jgi:hypothetical protein